MLKAKRFLDKAKYFITQKKYSANIHKLLGIAVFGKKFYLICHFSHAAYSR